MSTFGFAYSFLPTPTQLQIDYQCAKMKLTKCSQSNNPTTFKAALDNCKIVLHSQQCDLLTKEDKENANKLKHCEPEQFCRDSLVRSYFSLKGCANGYWSGTKELVMDLVNAINNRVEFLKACDKSISCKRDLIKDHPSYASLSDEKLNEFNATYLESAAERVRSIKATSERLNQPSLSLRERAEKVEQMERQREVHQKDPPINPIHESALIKAAEDWIRAQGVKFECYNVETQAEMICYGVSQILDPTAAVGTVAKLPKIAKVFKSYREAKKSSADVHPIAETARGAESSALSQQRVIGSAVDHNSILDKGTIKKQLLNAEYSTEEQNLLWIKSAAAPRSPKVKFVEVENSKLKNLNDSLKDKDLVTSITNMHKQLTTDEFKKLAIKYPNLRFSPYSDYKSVRYAIEGDFPADFEKDLNQAFSTAQKKFESWVSKNKLVNVGERPEFWFKMGIGELADEASMASRYARGETSSNKGFNFDSPKVKAELTRKLNDTENLRKSVLTDLGNSKLVQKSPHGDYILTPEAFEILRKSESATEVSAKMKARFSLDEFSEITAQKMLNYSKSVDQFSPSLHIAKREVASLETAVHGGFSVDFVGMGAHNLYGTAVALAGKSDLAGGLVDARKAEKEVTSLFSDRRQTVREVSEGTIRNKLDTVCSGDDCVGIAKAPMTQTEKQKIIDNFANLGDGSNVRVAFIPPKIANPEARSQLASHGEGVEKFLRNRLEGEIDQRKLKGILFAVDMKTTNVGQGHVSLMTGTPSAMTLSAQEKKAIDRAFRAAVADLNKSLKEKKGYEAN